MWRSVATGRMRETHNDRNQTWLHTCYFLLSHWRPSSWIGPFVTKYSQNGGKGKVHTTCLYDCVYSVMVCQSCVWSHWGVRRKQTQNDGFVWCWFVENCFGALSLAFWPLPSWVFFWSHRWPYLDKRVEVGWSEGWIWQGTPKRQRLLNRKVAKASPALSSISL